MKKIVIVTDHTEKSANLIARAHMIFPECEIEILDRTDRSEYENSSYCRENETCFN
jgi:hypothetical protein